MRFAYAYARPMTDPFDLVAKGDLDGLRSALSHDPGLVDTRHGSGASLVAWAAYMGNVGAISAIRAKLSQLDPHEAIILRDGQRLESALAAGWDPNQRSEDGFTPLSLAAFFDNAEAFDLLLPLTADVNAAARNSQQVSALHAACAKRNTAMVEKLLLAGADPNQVQADGFTPLHAAAQHGDGAIAGLLLLAGARVRHTNSKGDDAAALARKAGHDWLADKLDGLVR